MMMKSVVAKLVASRMMKLADACYKRGKQDHLAGCYDERRFSEAIKQQLEQELKENGL